MASLKRQAVLFDFFNGTEPDGSPRVASFRYYKTDGSPSEKLNCTRSFEDVAKIITKKESQTKEAAVGLKQRETPNLKQNHMIRIRFVNKKGETDFRNLKIKLLTHYRPSGSAEWFEIIHPSR